MIALEQLRRQTAPGLILPPTVRHLAFQCQPHETRPDTARARDYIQPFQPLPPGAVPDGALSSMLLG
jgi:hypothetical protein